MQFIMKPSISFDSYEMALFDSVKDSVDVSKLNTLSSLSTVLRKARSFLGQDYYLNPVRGKNANGNYYLTYLRYSYYGFDGTADIRTLDAQYTATQTGVGKHLAAWSSAAKADGSLKTDYLYESNYNQIAPVPSDLTSVSATVNIYGPKVKLTNTAGVTQGVTSAYNRMQRVQPGIDNILTTVYAYSSATPLSIGPSATTDYLQTTTSMGFSTNTAFLNVKSNSSLNVSPSSVISNPSAPHDGLVYLTDISTQTNISNMPTDVVNVDTGLIWFDTTRWLKLTAGDWTLTGNTDPGSRPKLALNSFNRAISL